MDERLQALLDYTIFHIGVYLTMGAGIIAADFIWHKHAKWLWVVVVLLLVAGAAGGTVASNIPVAAKGITIEEFLVLKPTLFFNRTLLIPHGYLTQIEHGAFWLAICLLCAWFFYWNWKGQSPFEKSGQARDTSA